MFLGMGKPMILRIPWLCKENPYINWTQATMVVKKGQNCIWLPLERQKDDSSAHHVDRLSAKQLDKLLQKNIWIEHSWGRQVARPSSRGAKQYVHIEGHGFGICRKASLITKRDLFLQI